MECAVDESFVCNLCLEQLHIARYKCTCCVDFDVCEQVWQRIPPCNYYKPIENLFPSQQCLEAADESHKSHIFLKIKIEETENQPQQAQNEIPSIAEQLAVLDGVQFFRLDQDAISKQCKC